MEQQLQTRPFVLPALQALQPINRMLWYVLDKGGFHNSKEDQEHIVESVYTRAQIYNKYRKETLKASSALSRLEGAPLPPPAPAPTFPFSTYSW